jgi:hypothetical protein
MVPRFVPRFVRRHPRRDRAAARRLGSVAVAAVAGCSLVSLDAPDLPRGDENVDLSTMAVLVGSVTQSDPLQPGRNSYTDVTFTVQRVAGGGTFRLKNAQLGIRHPAAPDADGGLEAIHGRLFAVPAPPGTYELRKISLWFQSAVQAVLPEPPRVTVGAGEVVYVGNLTVENCYSVYVRPDGQRVRSTVVGGFPAVNDHSARDLPLLRATYPALRETIIDVRVLTGSDVSAQAQTLSRACSFEREDAG